MIRKKPMNGEPGSSELFSPSTHKKKYFLDAFIEIQMIKEVVIGGQDINRG